MEYSYQAVERFIHVDALVMVLDRKRQRQFYFPGESHDFWEGVFVYRGQVTATADERVYRLRPGMFVLHKPLEFHRIWAEGEEEPRFINISFRAGGLGMRRFESTCFDLDSRQQSRFWEVVEAFRRATDFPTPPPEPITPEAVNLAAARLETFLLELSESGEHSPRSQSPEEQRYAKIVEVMKENSHRALSLTELAVCCGLSVSNMKRIFRMFSDVGVGKFYLSLRIRRAMELLDGGVSAAEVAERLNFQEISYFYTVFKRETGMTPTQYKNRKP